MKKKLLIGLFCLMMIIAFFSNSGASMIDFGTYTLDTTTGLEWLDFGSAPQEGFRLATVTEFIDMMAQMGFQPERAIPFYQTALADPNSEASEIQATILSLNLMPGSFDGEPWGELGLHLWDSSMGFVSVLIHKQPTGPEGCSGNDDYLYWYGDIFPITSADQQHLLLVRDTAPCP